MICYCCQQDKPITAFSTLPRLQGFETKSDCCTECYLRHLVSEYPEYQTDGSIIYRPKEQPQTDLVYQIGRLLPKWAADPSVIKKYADLGNINEQIAPFWEFAKGLKPAI